MTIFLRDHTQNAVVDSLLLAGVLVLDIDGNPTAAPGYAYDPIGLIYKGTGEFETIEDEWSGPIQQEIMLPVPGWHANILGDLTDEQREMLPIIPAPEPLTPDRVFA